MTTNGLIDIASRQERIQSFAFVIAISTAVCFSACFAISSLSTFEQPCQASLDGKINPNDAQRASLLRLPGVGVGRAEAIVSYREKFREQNRGKAAFENIDDLQMVKGIGPKTAEKISEWLKFE